MLRLPSIKEQVVTLLRALRHRNIKLVLKNKELSFIAPKGSLGKEDIQAITMLRAPIIEHLQRQGTAMMGSGGLSAPLAFSQLKHWRYHLTTGCAPVRDVAMAVRVDGRIDVGAMERSFKSLLDRHNALRTRIVLVNDVPEQQVVESGNWELQRSDLREVLPPLRLGEARRQIHEMIMEPVRFDTGPLFAIRLISIEEDEYVLVIVTEHIISDAASVSIILNDLLSFYFDATGVKPFAAPAAPAQFIDYALWQRSAHDAWLDEHGGYWAGLIQRHERLTFPPDKSQELAARRGRAVAHVKVGRDLKIQVRNRCREARSTLVMGVFAAYAACVLRWCGVVEAVIGFQTDGRMTPQVQNSVGFFASTLYLKIRLDPDMTYVDLLRYVTNQYREASQHADACYLETAIPTPSFVGNAIFNWLPAGVIVPEADDQRPLSITPFRFENPSFSQTDIDREPLILLYDDEDGVDVSIFYSPRKLRQQTMRRFAQEWMSLLEKMAENPTARIADLHVTQTRSDAMGAR